MNKRFLAVLLVVMAALAVLAIVLTLTTRGEEPLSDTALPVAWSADRTGQDEPHRFQAGGEKRADAPASDAASPESAGEVTHALTALATVRIEVDEAAQRASPVFAALTLEGAEKPAFSGEVGEFREWGVPPGRWELSLTGTGWLADVAQFELAVGGRQVVRVTARSRVAGLLVAARSGRPVEHATITPRFLHGEPGKLRDYFETPSLVVDAPQGHFALAGFNLPSGGSDFSFAVFEATSEGLLDAKSDFLPFQPAPFWSGVVIAFPDPILTGRVRGTGPDLGDVPVPGAWLQLVGEDVGLANFVLSGGGAFPTPGGPAPLGGATADVEGAFSFGPLPQAPTVLHARILVTADQWMELLSDPIVIDQQTTLHDVELRLHRGGRVYATLRVPLAASTGPGPRNPVARVESMTMTWLDSPPGMTPSTRAPMARQVIPSGDPEQALFEFDEGGLSAGRWRLVVPLAPNDSGTGHPLIEQMIIKEVEVLADQRTDVLLEYPSDKGGLTLAGTARFPDDFVPDSFEVFLMGPPEAGRLSTPVAYVRGNTGGEFELHHVPVGDWTLVTFAATLQRRDIAIGASFAHIGSSSPPPLHVDLTHPQLLIHAGETTRSRRLLLAGHCGDPILDASIAAGRISVRPDVNGDARIVGLLPARWTLRAEGEPPAQVDFEIPAGAGIVRVELP
jgi:hypothetical protein